jgi:ADP-heptose:LPS heptosyltransferase
MKSNALRILVIRIDFFGDLLCTTPLLTALKQAHPDCFLAVLASKYNRGALAGNSDVDEIFEYVYSKQTERNRQPGILNAIIQRIRLILKLRRRKFDYVIIPNGGMHKNSVQFSRWLGAAHVLFNNADTEFDDRRAEHRASRIIEHEVLSGFRVARELVGESTPGPLRFMPPDELVRKAQAKLPGLKSPCVALHFSARVPERSWPYSRWCELAATLAKTHAVVILGSPGMWEDPLFIDAMSASGLNGMAHQCPTADFAGLAAALSICDRVICCDGGPVHISAALKKPVVVLFENRPEKYKRWHPWAVPYQIALPRKGTAVESIEVADVVAAYERLVASPVTVA